jgi:hypothetical protein
MDAESRRKVRTWERNIRGELKEGYSSNGDFREMSLVPRGIGIRGQSLENHRSLEQFTSAVHAPLGSNDFKQQQNDDDQQDQSNAAATVVPNSRTQTIATKPKDKKQDNKNDQHTFSFADIFRVNQQQL